MGGVARLAFSADGTRLATGDYLTVTLWDLATAQKLATIRRHGNPIRSIVLSFDGRTLATSSRSREVHAVNVWDLPPARKPEKRPPAFES